MGGQHVLLQSLSVTCKEGHTCGGLMTPPSKFTSVLRSFLVSSSAAHHSCSVVGELIAIKLFHKVLHAKDGQFCCLLLSCLGERCVQAHQTCIRWHSACFRGGIGEFWGQDAL